MPQAIVTSPLPPERLNQIAAAKLNALGLRTQLDVERQLLRGELPFKLGKVVHPGNNSPLASAAFSVLGHDHVQFASAPLAALGPVMFYDLGSTDALEERIAATLHQHLSAMAGAADRLKRLRVNARFDADRLQVIATVSTVSHVFELTVGPGRTWVSRVTPLGGKPVVLPEPSHPVEVGAFQKLVDLELYLSDLVPALLESAARPRAVAEPAAARRAPQLEAVPAPRDVVTLGMLVQHLGAGAVFNSGEVSQEFTFDRATYRFSATHVSGTTFKGRLTGPQGEKWSDRFDVQRFPGIASVVATVLGTKAPAPEAPAQAAGSAAPTPSPFPSHLVPHVGEVWVMNVIVER